MDQTEARAVIKYLNKKGMISKDIRKDMVTTLGQDSPSYSTVKKWVVNFKTVKSSNQREKKRKASSWSAVSPGQCTCPHSTGGFEPLPHPSYSPDLAPLDFYLFPKLKFHLRGHRFETDDDVIQAVEAYLRDQDETFFQRGIEKLEH
uniref:Uncharacterized protein LOC100368076 n=1 Tax=Saccoglossus kowalevskii TaxID=10224 RepID=A0ABM0ME77_SACKO|nr:PREDICTED: uncharacterized protein LOC100368076 [Saccoglossus kowalevskii]